MRIDHGQCQIFFAQRSRPLESPEGGRFAIAIIVNRWRGENCAQRSVRPGERHTCANTWPTGVTTNLSSCARYRLFRQLINCAQAGHRDLFGMAVEGVERHSAEDRVAQGGHLLELITRSRLAARTVPRAPFVDHQLYRWSGSSSPIICQWPLISPSMRSPSRSSSYQSTASKLTASPFP